MGYTDPFASSTGLNYLVTVLDQFANGDEGRMLDPDVESAFEEFQRNVPFVALTTIQMRDSVEQAEGTLDAFVMEWQTFVNTDVLRDGYEFVPFGVRHDNPLYAVGDADDDTIEALEVFADFVTSGQTRARAATMGFDPPAYEPTTEVHTGETLIEAQKVWKEKKDGGRPVVAMFVTDVSGSMAGGKLHAVRESLAQAVDFISPTTSVGLVTFDDVVRLRVPIAEFDLNQRGAFAAAVEDMSDGGGTAMYDAVIVALDLLLEEAAKIPDSKPMLLVLTDGEVTAGMSFDSASRVIEGLGIPVYTVGYEANLEEIGRLSSLVEAASLNATEEDIAYKLGQLFNAEL
jgi:Ca-activated chloride channel family protein